MEVGSRVIVREPGAFFGMEGVIEDLPSDRLIGRGFDIAVPRGHQKATVIVMGSLGIFVSPLDLELA